MKDDAIYDDISSTSNEDLEERIDGQSVVVEDFDIRDQPSHHPIRKQLIDHHDSQSRQL